MFRRNAPAGPSPTPRAGGTPHTPHTTPPHCSYWLDIPVMDEGHLPQPTPTASWFQTLPLYTTQPPTRRPDSLNGSIIGSWFSCLPSLSHLYSLSKTSLYGKARYLLQISRFYTPCLPRQNMPFSSPSSSLSGLAIPTFYLPVMYFRITTAEQETRTRGSPCHADVLQAVNHSPG